MLRPVACQSVSAAPWTRRRQCKLLIPDQLNGDDMPKLGHGVFVTTVIAFFLAEMGDKPQVATVALTVRYPADSIAIVAGTTAGMMAASVPAVLAGAVTWVAGGPLPG